jgi:hemerythrin-like metal-binding protein
MVNALKQAEKHEFALIFNELISHTQAHFAYENNLMAETNYPAMKEHRNEHERVLGELTKLRSQLERGQVEPVRDFVSQRLPKWFRLHVLSMDNALAAHVQK